MLKRKRPRWSSQTKIMIIAMIMILVVYLLYRFSEVIPPLIIAIILAYILTPIANALTPRLFGRRWLAILLVYLVLILISIALPLIIVPQIVAQFTGLNVDIQRILAELESLLSMQIQIGGQIIDGAYLFERIVESLQGLLEPFFGSTLNFAVEFITSLVWIIFILVVSIYLVKDATALRDYLEGIVPPEYRNDYIILREEINKIWSAFFRGQLVLASVVASIFMSIGFVLGLPFWLAMGLLAGLLEFLPSLGHGIWFTIATSLALFVGSTWIPIPNWAFMFIVAGLHAFFMQFDVNYLIPRIIGRSVHLPPLVIILGIVAGAALGGILGIALAAPTIASARVLGRYLYAYLFDLDPFPGTAIPPLPPPDPRWWQTLRPVKWWSRIRSKTDRQS